MKLWDEIVRVAILGTERVPLALPPPPEALATLLEQTTKMPREEALLACAAYVSGWQAAGAVPPTLDDVAAAPEEITEERGEATARETSLLRAMIDDAPGALTEAFRTLDQRNRCVPLRLLPELFALAARSRELRAPLGAAMGRRGAWLAAQRADWRFMLGEVATLDATAWDGDRPERVAYLRTLREHDPAQARELVAACWKAEPAANRRDFLSTFEVAIGTPDEAFLDAALDDRSREVRATAASLLGRIPGSAFMERMSARARATIRQSSGLFRKSLNFEPPAELTAEDKRDGLEANARQEGTGWRAQALMNIVSATPLDLWTEATGLDITPFLNAVMKSDWREALTTGIRTAILAQGRGDWAATYFAHGAMENVDIDDTGSLARLLDADRLDAIAKSDPERIARVAHVLDAPWSRATTEAIGPQIIKGVHATYWTQDVAGRVGLLAERGALAYHSAFAKTATAALEKETPFTKVLNEALRKYQLRHDFHEESHR